MKISLSRQFSGPNGQLTEPTACRTPGHDRFAYSFPKSAVPIVCGFQFRSFCYLTFNRRCSISLIHEAASHLSHCVLFRVDAAQPRLPRAFRMAPFSRQTNLNPVWHSPRSHSRPATLPRTPFCPFYRPALFLPAAAQVKEETSRERQKDGMRRRQR